MVDFYVEGERSVVMVGENVLGLSEIATHIVTAVPETVSIGLEEVTASVVATFGEPDPPASAAELTLQQVHDLAAHEVLLIDEDPGTRATLHAHRGSGDQTSDAVERAVAVDALRGALRHLRSNVPAMWSPPSGLEPSALVAAAHQHHVVPFVAGELDRLALSPQASAELRVAANRTHIGATILAADLARVIGVLDAVGVRALAFKGIALAAQAYLDFAIRGAGDLDVLVAPADLESAHVALSGAGWRPSLEYPSPGPSWAWRHFARTDNELPLTNSRTIIDLHWHLAPTRGTYPSFETLWSRREVVDVDGHLVPTLGRYDALAHSAGHAARDQWRWLRSLLDVHQLASQRETWAGADRPLRGDQLITLGLAARVFGVPDCPPSVIGEALARSDQVWRLVLAEQAATAPVHRSLKVPGHSFLRNIRTTSRTGGTSREALRLLGRSALPPWLTADESSPHASVAVPRVLTRRVRELLAKALAAGS